MAATRNIEKLLAGVRTIEGNAATADEGLIVRRVVERAENNWNLTNDNSGSVVVKEFSADDLNLAAQEIGLAGNDAVEAFIESAFADGDDEGKV